MCQIVYENCFIFHFLKVFGQSLVLLSSHGLAIKAPSSGILRAIKFGEKKLKKIRFEGRNFEETFPTI